MMKFHLAFGLLVLALPVWAQPVPPSAPPAPAAAAEQTEPGIGGEPNVRHVVIEDKGSKIDELHVRGQTRRITVTPKVGTSKSYEILTGDASRELPDGTGGARNATGKRVWNIFDF